MLALCIDNKGSGATGVRLPLGPGITVCMEFLGPWLGGGDDPYKASSRVHMQDIEATCNNSVMPDVALVFSIILSKGQPVFERLMWYLPDNTCSRMQGSEKSKMSPWVMQAKAESLRAVLGIEPGSFKSSPEFY